MSKNRKLIIGSVGVLAVVGLGGLALANPGNEGVEVRTEAVARRDLVSTVTASGKIEPKRKVDISADISGRVLQVAVEEGQWVERGDLLIRIDATQYAAVVRSAEASVAQAQARAAQARARLLQAESAVRRAERLAEGDNLISQEALEQARTEAQVAAAEQEAAGFSVQQAQAALSEARDRLAKTTIVAPMSGRVTRLNIEEGETAIVGTMNNPGSLLLTIADLSVMEAKVEVDETDVPQISVGDSASVRVDAFPGKTFAGRVTQIGNSSIQPAGGMSAGSGSGQQSVDYEVIVTLDDPPAELRPDLSATADIVTDQRRQVLAVPIIALTVRDSAGKKAATEQEESRPGVQAAAAQVQEVEGVFVIVDGKAKWLPVEIGIAGDRYFEVVQGLEGGETVISGTYQVIRDLEADAPVRAPAASEKKGGKVASTGGER